MKARMLLGLLLLHGLGIFVSSCVTPASTSEDSWHRPPPAGTLVWQWPELNRTRIQEVVASEEAEAEALLADVSVLALTNQQAAEFAGKALPDVPGTKPYLTRAVYLAKGTGRFTVYVSGDQLVVSHSSLGLGGYQMRRQALVLQLQQAPAEVFVECKMAK